MSDKLDLLPNIEHVIKMSESFNNAGLKMSDNWNRDQKPDFYLGMFSAMRVFQSAVITMQKDWATTDSERERLEHLQMECAGRLGEIANIIMDKYELKGF